MCNCLISLKDYKRFLYFFSFGSTIISNATGIIWNNEMQDFDTKPEVNMYMNISSILLVLFSHNLGIIYVFTSGEDLVRMVYFPHVSPSHFILVI